jgi:hypothetical protein
VVERLRALGFHNVHEISFGSPSRDRHQANMRAYMWFRLKEWLGKGAIPDEEGLAGQLAAPGYHINTGGKLVITRMRTRDFHQNLSGARRFSTLVVHQ